MAIEIPNPFTWQSLFRIILLVLAEGALFAVVREIPVILMTAIVVASVGCFVAIEAGEWLRSKHRHAVLALLTISGAVLVVSGMFVGYYAIQKQITKREIKALYVEAEQLVKRGFPLKGTPPPGGPYIPPGKGTSPWSPPRDPDLVAKEIADGKEAAAAYAKYYDEFHSDLVAWEEKAKKVLEHRIGPVARARFTDFNSDPVTRLMAEKNNLAIIIENPAYE